MTETAKMYGGSLYDLAAEEGLETRILGELDEVHEQQYTENQFFAIGTGCAAYPYFFCAD
mgnify:CR=1 FL=1